MTHVRFATASVGYLFGPALFVTRDGGRSWARENSPPVESLEPGSGGVVRLVYDHTGCPGPCDRTVQVAPAGSTTWRTLVRLGFPRADSRETGAELIRGGSGVIYVPIYGSLAAGAGTQHTIIFRSLDGGRSWRRLGDPCGGSGFRVHDAVALAAVPGGLLAALCVPRTATPKGRFVLTSTDEGSSWGPRRPVPGSPWLIAAASSTHLVVADGPAGGRGPHTYRLAASADGGVRWKTIITDREQINPSAPSRAFLGFEDADVGRWVGYERAVWTTRDGGAHWIRRPFR
ncbi:MAG: sialidase family protein [Gaiellaceae bacterium]